MKIMGYVDRLSGAGGDTLKFRISTAEPRYRADLVRLRHGHTEGPGFKEEVLSSSVSGEYPGKHQALPLGSYMRVDRPARFPDLREFSLVAWVSPTVRDQRQSIVSRWDSTEQAGWELGVSETLELYIRIGSTRAAAWEKTVGAPMRLHAWYFVAGTYSSGVARLLQLPLTPWPFGTDSGSVVAKAPRFVDTLHDAPLLLAACADADAPGRAARHFNGKIDSPAIYRVALGTDDLASIAQGRSVSPEHVEAKWDFSLHVDTSVVEDKSGRGHHGTTVNWPARACTGHLWTGQESDFRQAPQDYSAIHFHEDDLEDANWELGFSLTIPKELSSGAYAARIRCDGGQDYVPFWVRPQRGHPRAHVAFLASTLTDLAYANHCVFQKHPEAAEFMVGREGMARKDTDEDRAMVDLRLLSVYDVHADGSGVYYASSQRPLLSMRPMYTFPATNAPHGFNADLCVTDWLDEKGWKYDVITDYDLHDEGASLLDAYSVLITGSHPEYWTAPMLEALESYLGGGGRLMYLGGNGFWHPASIPRARPHVVEIRRSVVGTRPWEASPGEEYHAADGQRAAPWRSLGRSSWVLAGLGTTAIGADRAQPYERRPESFDRRVAFMFEGVEPGPIGAAGLFLNGAAGWEIDRADRHGGTPPHALVVASATGFSELYQGILEDVCFADSRQGGTVSPLVRSDIVYFEHHGGGAVFSVGSMCWVGCLSLESYRSAVSRITENVLRAFVGAGRAGRHDGNWKLRKDKTAREARTPTP